MNAGQTYAFLTPIGPMTAEEKAGALTSLMPGGTLGAGEAPTPLLRFLNISAGNGGNSPFRLHLWARRGSAGFGMRF